MKQTFDVRNENDCRRVTDLVGGALKLGFDVTVTTTHPERVGGGQARQVVVDVTEPPAIKDLIAEREATEAQNRAGLERTIAALDAVGDPDPLTTIAFVGEATAFEQAQAEHVARFGLEVRR